MSETTDVVYKSLEMKIQSLMDYVRFLRKKNELLSKELREKEETINRLQNMLLEEEEKYKLLAVAGVMAKGEEVKEATRRVNNLVREIDECIALLTKE